LGFVGTPTLAGGKCPEEPGQKKDVTFFEKKVTK
jgi:hypothetical protein